ncbi:polysaccharide lyase family protein [Streptomyces sp. NPDC050560]|uniref:polysaccharide lyase family protein n=1 Tax=Streptomyces sp. NPDC050560 TaxID=3365630 RepID=UPI00379273B3
MSWDQPQPNRRTTLGLIGGGAVALTAATAGGARADEADATGGAGGGRGGGAVTVLVNGEPAAPGSYAFPGEAAEIVLDNGLVRFTFGRDDATGGIVTGWDDVSITATSVVVDGTELAHHLGGVEPRDPDRQHSFYIDAAGGKSRLVCTRVDVVRVEHDLVEVAFADVTSDPLRHEHHLVMRAGRRGLYGYNILTATADTSIGEVRMNTRWDRAVLDHCFNWERGKGQQPTYAYLATQEPLSDETWRIDGVDNPDLPSPENNAGGLAPGTVYTKYNWSLYHYQNPMFGHYGNGFGAWFTPLSGVSDRTLAGFYGVGPQRQDLAIHQDALILNYFSPNHYGLPGYELPAGYRRLYGPWFTFLTTGDPDDPDAMIDEAARTAHAEIDEHRAGAAWLRDPLYPEPEQRTTVSGRVRLTDGRPAADLWVLLSTQDLDDVYTLHEGVHFVRTGADGSFTLPGVPPAWRPGSTAPGSYTLYVFSAGGSATDQYKRTGLTFHGRHHQLPTVVWSPARHGTFRWQIGTADRTGGEYALATGSPARPSPRAYEKPSRIPGDLHFTIGASWEPEDWYYAHPNPGTWTVHFPLDEAPSGTAYLTVSSSMQQGTPPAVAVNGTADGVSGELPRGNDSSIGRQADRSAYPRRAVLSFPASLLRAGDNTIAFTNAAPGGLAPRAVEPVASGYGWDTLVLEIDDGAHGGRARLTGRVTGRGGRHGTSTWHVEITNHGGGTAYDVRLDSLTHTHGTPKVAGRDPNAFPVPVTAALPPGASASLTLRVTSALPHGSSLTAGLTADGGRTRGTARGARVR